MKLSEPVEPMEDYLKDKITSKIETLEARIEELKEKDYTPGVVGSILENTIRLYTLYDLIDDPVTMCKYGETEK